SHSVQGWISWLSPLPMEIEVKGSVLTPCKAGGTCRRGIYAGKGSKGIQSPAIFPGDNIGPTHFQSTKTFDSLNVFPDDMSPGIVCH
ncbi:hypothetical protein Tco_1573642, partial [Tanacetum coccineum]